MQFYDKHGTLCVAKAAARSSENHKMIEVGINSVVVKCNLPPLACS